MTITNTQFQEKLSLLTGRGQSLPLIGVLLVSLSLLLGLGCYGLIDPSDGFYSEGAREMLERRDYFTPSLNYQPFYEKPIGIYWLIMSSFKIFGVHEFAARVPSALAALVCAFFTAHVMMKCKLRRAGVLSAIVLLSTPLYSVVARLSLTDMPLCACLSVAILCTFYVYVFEPKRAYLLLGYISLALALLLKGPVSVILFSAIFVLQYLLVVDIRVRRVTTFKFANESVTSPTYRNFFDYASRSFSKTGILLFLLISLPWFLYESIHTHGAFFQEFIIRQNFGRMAGYVNHKEPWYFYLWVYFAGTLPWCLPLLCSATFVRGSFRRSTPRSKLLRLSVLWLLSVLFIYSCSSAKLATYIVPAMVPTSIIVGMVLDRTATAKNHGRIKMFGLVSVALLIATPLVLSVKYRFWNDVPDLALLVCSLFVSVLCAVKGWNQRLCRRALNWFIVGLSLSLNVGVSCALHSYEETRCRPQHKLFATAANYSGSIATFLNFAPGELFYAKRSVTHLTTKNDYLQFVANTPAPHLVIVERRVSNLVQVVCPGLLRLKEEGDFVLMRNQN